MKVSIVICTYNRAEILKLCLERICNQSINKDFEILVIDNNSSDHTHNLFEEFIANNNYSVKPFYYLETNQGLSAARNRGIKESIGEYITYIDDDALVPLDFAEILITYINCSPGIVGIGGKIIPKYIHSTPQWVTPFTYGLVTYHDLGSKIRKYESIGIYPAGCNMTYKKSVLEEVGGFDELLVRRCDDKYIAYEVKKKGYEIFYNPDLVLEHYIDDVRLNNRLDFISKDTGYNERLRIRNRSIFFKIAKLIEYIFKFFASFLIMLYYLFKFEKEKGLMIFKMRWWMFLGFINKNPN